MSKHTVYVSTGEIYEYISGRSFHKRHLKLVRQYADKGVHIYFRPTEQWRLESVAYLQEWKRLHNIF